MRALVVGLGIGNLYKDILDNLGIDTVTVDKDPLKKANFINLDEAIQEYEHFDLSFVCTPNYTHQLIAERVAENSDIILVEKPGFIDAESWMKFITDHNSTRAMMIKNNMWRDNIETLKQYASESTSVNISWIRKDCVPNPGGWFTNKDLAYGGVSRDLMPHLLSLYVAINPEWEDSKIIFRTFEQHWRLEDITSTEYGQVYTDGEYNVDDCCIIDLDNNFHLVSNWRSLDTEKSNIEFYKNQRMFHAEELGWCPGSAYERMIVTALENKNNHEFWKQQASQDSWILSQVGN